MNEQPSEVTLETASVTDRGLSEKRPLNEDSFLADAERRIFAVADGVGGAEAGEVASQTAIEVLDEAFRHHKDGEDIEDLMEIAIQRANASIYQLSHEERRFSMMATTIVALHLNGRRATIGHVGDSRLYRLTPDGQLQRETDDHSVVEEEVRAGRMSPEQAANHPSRNVISRALGAEPSVEVDMKTLEVEDGTIFLLCSDGVTRHIQDAEISSLLREEESLEAACAEIKRRCFERGAEDNLTAVTIRVGAPVKHRAAEDETERTLISERQSTQDAQLAAAASTTLLQRPFDSASADSSRLNRPTRISGEVFDTPTENNTSVAPVRTPTGRAGTWFGVILLLLLAALGAFFGGIKYQKQKAAESAALALASATPTPESPAAKFERIRREIDLSPNRMVSKLSNEANGLPMQSNDPEFLYLYGRALMLSGKHQDALQAFNLAAQKINEHPTQGRDPLKVDARIATAAAALKSNNPDATRTAAMLLDEVIELKAEGATTTNASPVPTPTP